MTDFRVPELGENVAGGDVTRVLVNVGDTIARDQSVLELETDKATIEVPSSVAGVVTGIAVKKGDKIRVGAVVLTVDEAAGGAADAPQKPDPPTTMEQKQGEPGPATSEAASPPRGAPRSSGARGAESVARGSDQKVVSMPSRSPAPAPPPPAAPRSDREGPAAPASPAVRRLAREIGVDVNQVHGTGPAGRISLDDVKKQARRILTSIGTAGTATAGAARGVRPLPDFAKWGEVDRQPWSNIRRTTSEHLSHAWTTIPHVTQCDKADVTALEQLRTRYKDRVAQAGGSLTVTAMLVRILATAVRQFPQFNCSVDTERGELVFKKYVNMGVAVDTDRGLLVPVIRHADRKSIQEIAIEVHQAADRARDRKLTLDDMSGGSMTISNLGGIGGTYFTPIVNWPEVAILGVSRTATEAVWNAGSRTFEPRQLLPLSLSYDHRAIDGADAMRFLRWVVEAIEQPFLLSLIG